MSTRSKAKSRFPFFWVFYLLFFAAFIGFWVWVVSYVRDCMVTYEAAQPDLLMDGILEDFRAGKLTRAPEYPVSRFEDGHNITDAYQAVLAGELTWERSAGSYDSSAPAYDIYSDGKLAATVKLREKSSETLMLMLTKQDWELGDVTSHIDGLAQVQPPFTVTVPDSFTVSVNGLPLGEAELTGETEDLPELQYAAEYVAVPHLVEYRVEGLYLDPTVEVTDRHGRTEAVELPADRAIRVNGFPAAEMDPDLMATVLKNAKDYSNFFSRDLPGCTTSVDCLRHMFPKGSLYLNLANEYRKVDMAFYSAHSKPTFSEEQVTNYIVYTDELFTCDVHFDKKMILTRTGDERHDVTNSRVTYVLIDGSWLIADMCDIV